MKVSKLWLDKFFDAPLPAADVLADALTFHAFEIDGIEKKGDDDVLDVKVTPNRGHDCLSHRGIAKELSAILKLPFAHDSFGAAPDLSKKAPGVTVSVQRPDLCKRYLAGYVTGVKVGPSPEWLKKLLEAVGQRSINNVVDATNFVMFNTGQPLHAFDAKKLGSLELGVRLAKDGEVMVALDKKEYKLDSSMLVITAAGNPVGIAGVKGGMPAAVDESTADIVIESANFDGVSVRKTAAALKLRTDASARFEQVLSPGLAAYGMGAAVELIQKIAGGEVQGFVDAYPEPQEPHYASVTVEKVNQVLGTTLTGADVAAVFVRLGLPYKEQGGVFEVSVPFERLDLHLPEDLVEEVGRIVGFDKVPATPLPPLPAGRQGLKNVEINPNFYAAEKAREELAAQGYSEVFTSVFADKGERAVANKIGGDRPYLRSSLVPGLEDALKKNIPNKDLLGLKEIKLFEVGVVWRGDQEVTMLGTIAEKQKAQEKTLEPVQAAQYERLPLSTADRFAPFSKYPYVVRDIAMWVPAGTDEKVVLEQIKSEAGGLAQKVSLFDRFEKAGKVSLAYRIIFQSFDRTLTEKEVNEIMDKVSAALKAQGFEIR